MLINSLGDERRVRLPGQALPTSPATEAYKRLSQYGQEAAPSLIEALPTLPDAAAWRAADLLGQAGDPNAVPALSTLLSHPAPLVRNEAAAALSKLGLSALPHLLEGLSRPDAPTAEIARALSRIDHPDVLPALQQLALSTDPETAYIAVHALAEIRPDGPDFLRRHLIPEGTPVTPTLLDVLLTNPAPEYTRDLVTFALLSPEPAFRQAAVRVLQRLKNPVSTFVLTALASDPDPDTREAAKSALQDPVHGAGLVALATSDFYYYADKASSLLGENLQAIAEIEKQFRDLPEDNFSDRSARARLLHLAGWEYIAQDVRVQVALYTADWNMLAYASPRTRGEICKALTWPEPRLREGAARMLGLHGSHDEVMPLAHTLENDESVDTALSARDSLVRLGRIGIPGLRSVQGDVFSLLRAAEGLNQLSYRPGLHSEKAAQALLGDQQDQLYRLGPGAVQDCCKMLNTSGSERLATAQQLARMADRGCPSDQLTGLNEGIQLLLGAGDQDNRTDRMLAHTWGIEQQHLLLVPIFSRHQRFQSKALQLYTDKAGLATLCAQHLVDRDAETRRACERVLLQLDQDGITALEPLLAKPLSPEARYASRLLARLEYVARDPLQEARYRAARGQWEVVTKLGETGPHLVAEALNRDEPVHIRSILRTLTRPDPYRERVQELFLAPDEETSRIAATLLARDESGSAWLMKQVVENNLMIAQRAQYGLSTGTRVPPPEAEIPWFAAAGAIGSLLHQKEAVQAYALRQLEEENPERQYDAARILMALRYAPMR